MLDPKAHDRQARGARAREFLDSPTFQDAVTAVDGWYREAMFATKPEDGEKREALFMEYNGFRRVLKRLTDWDFDGEMATRELATEEKKTNV